MLTIDKFRREFNSEVASRGVTWEVAGFLSLDGRIYSIGTDTKVISTIFETLAAPLIEDIAQKYSYEVSLANQTVYPDFTLTPRGKTHNRIAIDVKTTYQRSARSPIGFTLGSYTSFLRNGTKNICHPYHEYCSHWIIGFIYVRREGVRSKVHTMSEKLDGILCPYSNVRYFVQEKYRIAGLRPGSGNTANIGSFSTTDVEDLVRGRGPFAQYGEKVFEDYWKQYEKDGSTQCENVAEFLKKRTKA
jgi:hypothetical protein